MAERAAKFFSAMPGWAMTVFQVAGIIIAAWLFAFILKKMLRRRIEKTKNTRAGTLYSLLKSAVTYAVWLVALLQILEKTMGVSTATLVAMAGGLGVAIGFGAQSLVKDIINGFFLLLDDQYNVGETVTLDAFTGVVEELGLRATRLRNFEGDLFVVPNGSIVKVINHSRRPRNVIVSVAIAHGADTGAALEVLRDTAARSSGESALLTGVPEVLGVSKLDTSGVSLSVRCPCKPGDQFALEREMLLRIKTAFYSAGIELARLPGPAGK